MDDLTEEDIETIIENIADSIEIDELSGQIRSVLYKACEVADLFMSRNEEFDDTAKNILQSVFNLAKASKTIDYLASQYDVDFEPEEEILETMDPEGSVN